mmetsp:Transcript_30865/g.72764  ORF Transcript_30865/g.72764 Transcript_30865/m.72764 type:complete len:152 (+) Transcript_30865:145-600(+)
MAKSDKKTAAVDNVNNNAGGKKRKNPDDKSATEANKSEGGGGIDEFDKLFSDKKKQDREIKKEEAKKEAARKAAKKARYKSETASSNRNNNSTVNMSGTEWVDDGLGGKYNKEGFTGRVEDGVKVFKRHILNKPGAGTTTDCPFDCDCCFI